MNNPKYFFVGKVVYFVYLLLKRRITLRDDNCFKFVF